MNLTIADVEWRDPPPTKQHRRGGITADFVEVLKMRPGRWAVHPTPQKGSGNQTHNTARYPGTEWTARKRDDGAWDLFGRWIGEDS